jgi:hypothetical protein
MNSKLVILQKEVKNLSMSEKIERARKMLEELERITDRNIVTKARRMMSIQEALCQIKKIRN